MLFFGHYFIPESEDEVDGIIGDDWAAKYLSSGKRTICWGIKENIFGAGKPTYGDTF